MANSKAAELRAIWETIDQKGKPDGPTAEPDLGSLTVLRYGIEMSEWTAEFFDRAAEDLERLNSGVGTGGR